MDDPLLGTLVNSRYRLEKQLGSGGFGTVYLARDQQLRDRPVVVKILQEKVTADEWFQRKFAQEIEALSRIHHPGVVSVIDTGELPTGQPYMVQQFVEGTTLREEIRTGGMDLTRAAGIIRRTGQALTATHNRGIFHRDLKPENIMLQRVSQGDDHITLIDFGIASVSDPSSEAHEKTKVTGTFTYMAPEQFDGRPTAASDTYALAVIAYEMLAGVPPSTGRPLFEVMMMQKEGTWPRISTLRPSVPLAAQDAILKGLSHKPEDRFGSAQEFAETLSAALEAPPAEAAEIPALPSPPTISGRLLVFILAGTVIVSLLGAWWIWINRNSGAFKAPQVSMPQPKTLQLSYWVGVQPMKDNKPAGDAYVLSHERTFRSGDHIFFTVAGAGRGYLYIVNQDPVLRDGLPNFSVLFPTRSTNDGTAYLQPAQTVRIPAEGYFEFDKQQGVERIWLVWSDREIPALTNIPSSDSDLPLVIRRQVWQFLNDNENAKPTRQISEARMRTVLERQGHILVHRIDFLHDI